MERLFENLIPTFPRAFSDKVIIDQKLIQAISEAGLPSANKFCR